MPSRCVTTRAMSTAALPMRSIAETTCNTLDICSASRFERAASTHTSRISCTRLGEALLELEHLVGHARITEEQ